MPSSFFVFLLQTLDSKMLESSFFFSFEENNFSHGTITRVTAHSVSIYWVGQEVHLGFSITAHRKIQTNFLAKPILCFRPGAGKRDKH